MNLIRQLPRWDEPFCVQTWSSWAGDFGDHVAKKDFQRSVHAQAKNVGAKTPDRRGEDAKNSNLSVPDQ